MHSGFRFRNFQILDILNVIKIYETRRKWKHKFVALILYKIRGTGPLFCNVPLILCDFRVRKLQNKGPPTVNVTWVKHRVPRFLIKKFQIYLIQWSNGIRNWPFMKLLSFLTITFRMIESHFHPHCVLKPRNKQNKTYFIFILKDN